MRLELVCGSVVGVLCSTVRVLSKTCVIQHSIKTEHCSFLHGKFHMLRCFAGKHDKAYLRELFIQGLRDKLVDPASGIWNLVLQSHFWFKNS